MLTAADSYEGLRDAFRWQVPARYNIGVDVCDRWAETEPGRLALIQIGEWRAHAADVRRVAR